MNEIQRVTLGEKPADIVLTGGRVLLPELNDFVERDVAIKDDRVASLPRPESSSDLIGEETRVIDTEGKTVVPGFIDPHTHIDHQLTFETYYHHALEGGTTTVITEADAFGLALGSEGVEGLLEATSDLDINVLGTVPPQPFFDTFEPQEYYDKRAFVDLLKNDRIVGVGESDWIHVVGRDTPAEDLYEACHDLGKRVSGHGAGCSGVKLEAFASVIDNDHEAITGEQIVERVGNGIHAIGRGGSIRDDTRAVADAYEEIGPDELSLSSDGMWPTDMVEKGYMDFVVRRAIEEGVEPKDAVRMATLNPARHFKLDELGSITPGKRADVVILESLESVDVDTVVSAGKVVVEGGEARVSPKSYRYPDHFYSSVKASTDPENFRVPLSAASGGEVRAIKFEGDLVSTQTTVEPKIVDNELKQDPENDVLKATLLNRHPRSDGKGFTGFVTGFGFDEGAVATTTTWEVPGLLCVGADDSSMVRAVSRINEMNGGWVVVGHDGVIAEFPTPVAGVCSAEPIEGALELYDGVKKGLNAIGAEVERPMLAIQTLTFRGVPALKLSFSGYADILKREIVGLSL